MRGGYREIDLGSLQRSIFFQPEPFKDRLGSDGGTKCPVTNPFQKCYRNHSVWEVCPEDAQCAFGSERSLVETKASALLP